MESDRRLKKVPQCDTTVVPKQHTCGSTPPRVLHFSAFHIYIGLQNSRQLEVLSMSAHKSPLALKGSSGTYIRPLQRDDKGKKITACEWSKIIFYR